MVQYNKLIDLEFPDMPHKLLSYDKLRKHRVCSYAYISFSLKESNIDYNPDSVAPLITDATHNLETNLTAEQFIDASLGEIALAQDEIKRLKKEVENENVLDDLDYFEKEMGYLYKNITKIKNDTYFY